MDVHYLADEISQHAQCEIIIFMAVCINNVLFFFLRIQMYACIIVCTDQTLLIMTFSHFDFVYMFFCLQIAHFWKPYDY